MSNLSTLLGVSIPLTEETDHENGSADASQILAQKLFAGMAAAPYRIPRDIRRFGPAGHNYFNSQNNLQWSNRLNSPDGGSMLSSFCLLNDFIPKYLSAFTMVAPLLEPGIFKDFAIEHRSLHFLLHNPVKMMDPNETPVTHYVRLTECSEEVALKKLIQMNASPEAFFDTLTNLNNGALLMVVEHLLHEQVLPQILSLDFFGRQNKQHVFARLLMLVGAHRSTIKRITGISHASFNIMYRDFEEHFPHPLLPNSKSNPDPVEFLMLLQDPNKCRFSTLIISLYILAMRSILNLKATFRPLVLTGIPKQLCYTVAIGCYECVHRIYCSIDYEQWTQASFLEFFPSFEAVCDLLKCLLSSEIKIVGCSKCHTPYFVVNSSRLRRKLDLETCCPKCSSCSEYDPSLMI